MVKASPFGLDDLQHALLDLLDAGGGLWRSGFLCQHSAIRSTTSAGTSSPPPPPFQTDPKRKCQRTPALRQVLQSSCEAFEGRMGAGEGPARGPQDGDSGDTARVPRYGLWSSPSRVEAQQWPNSLCLARDRPGGRDL